MAAGGGSPSFGPGQYLIGANVSFRQVLVVTYTGPKSPKVKVS